MPTHRVRRPANRRGITLIEAVISLAVISVLLLMLSATVTLATHALPTETELGIADRNAHDIANQLRSDIAYASNIRYQTLGDSARITLDIIPTGAMGEGAVIVYEYDSANTTLTRRVDTRDPQTLSTRVTLFNAQGLLDSGQIRFAHIRMIIEGTIQQGFDIFVPTPYHPAFTT